MNIAEFFDQKMNIRSILLDFIENESNTDADFHNFILQLKESENNIENRNDLKELLHLISKISNNHHRSTHFFSKIYRILLHFKDEILQFFSNYEIFNVFKSNKRILLFLFENKIVLVNESIALTMMHEKKYREYNYDYFFFKEIKNFINDETRQIINEEIAEKYQNEIIFENKRKAGENDSFIYEIIRNDSIDEFVSYTNQANFPLSAIIKQSIFETNSFLLDKELTIIEYAAFFGSIQILKYLFLNGIELNQSLWIYAIHGKNPEIIHFLEENHIKPIDITYTECLMESIKCHHDDITDYLIQNICTQKQQDDLFLYHLKMHDYYYNSENNLSNELLFYYLCRYDYLSLVDLFLETTDILTKINSRII
ncbi:hypothetical protein M9Y10_001907 [Tritrichomonas musculus]|uniref:DUF3447 domain-containing protein n=1 Tax=Tritrichomonas musculus TaxID=1915356 RepID=A0ABR2L8B4_9EUKA